LTSRGGAAERTSVDAGRIPLIELSYRLVTWIAARVAAATAATSAVVYKDRERNPPEEEKGMRALNEGEKSDDKGEETHLDERKLVYSPWMVNN
jgi:hypothetical protein